jgi:uncharacterized protein (TIGR02588 family)
MVGSLVRHLRVLAPLVMGTVFVASVAAAPIAADAAGLAGSQMAAAVSDARQAHPDLQVTPGGVEVDAKGNTVYTFTVANTGAGLARSVKVTQLLQVKETASPQRVKKTVTVTEYDQFAAGQAQTVTIVCERSPRYTCEYGSVTATTADDEVWAGDNYAALGS